MSMGKDKLKTKNEFPFGKCPERTEARLYTAQRRNAHAGLALRADSKRAFKSRASQRDRRLGSPLKSCFCREPSVARWVFLEVTVRGKQSATSALKNPPLPGKSASRQGDLLQREVKPTCTANQRGEAKHHNTYISQGEDKPDDRQPEI